MNREGKFRPGTFRSRNVSLDRFFDVQHRHEKSAAREQWTRRSVLPDRLPSSGGILSVVRTLTSILIFHLIWFSYVIMQQAMTNGN